MCYYESLRSLKYTNILFCFKKMSEISKQGENNIYGVHKYIRHIKRKFIGNKEVEKPRCFVEIERLAVMYRFNKKNCII